MGNAGGGVIGQGCEKSARGHVSRVSEASDEGFRDRYKGGKWRESYFVSLNMHSYLALSLRERERERDRERELAMAATQNNYESSIFSPSGI